MTSPGTIAYFSMEVALESHLPTYAGGLGALAGDTLRSAADLGLSMVGVTLLHRRGYFFQRLDAEGRQHEEPVAWSPDDWLIPVDATCTVDVEGRPVRLRAWRYRITGCAGEEVPVFLLDTDVPGNDPWDRELTGELYGGDDRYRLAQEVVLGIGGVRMLRALGFHAVSRFHLNEGHSALLALELFAEELERTPDRAEEAIDRVKGRCIFTTHTPVPAGRDQFPAALAEQVLGRDRIKTLEALGCCQGTLNLTLVALNLSGYVNGVARRHGEISRTMFPGYPIGSVTNGVHSVTWTAPPFARLYDRHIPDWRRNSASLRSAVAIPLDEIRAAHEEAKRRLIAEVNPRTNIGFDQDVLTLGFARRASAYKRPALLLHDLPRLRALGARAGLQIVFAGKAHPKDEAGKALIQRIVQAGRDLRPAVKLVYLENYDVHLARLLTAGVDVWVNTPRPPLEASGTSGMKAAHNGVPSLSVLDGWWWEGHIEGATGWAIGARERDRAAERSDAADAEELYRTLEERIAPLFYGDHDPWTQMMRATIAINASFFNSQRMLQEYVAQAYRNDA
jgi:starch phosphorylase